MVEELDGEALICGDLNEGELHVFEGILHLTGVVNKRLFAIFLKS